jgi:hypothetical protein
MRRRIKKKKKTVKPKIVESADTDSSNGHSDSPAVNSFINSSNVSSWNTGGVATRRFELHT